MSFVSGLAHQMGRLLTETPKPRNRLLARAFRWPWLTAAQVRRLKFGTVRRMIAGIVPAIRGLPLGIATHWVILASR